MGEMARRAPKVPTPSQSLNLRDQSDLTPLRETAAETQPLLSPSPVISSQRRSRGSRMASEGKKTPGLDQSVQDFKAQPDRDPEKLNDDVKIKFEEIIAEPEGYHSSKYIWHLSNEVYLFCKDAGYQVMSLFCGIPMAAFWGVLFAFVACAHVWIYAPLKRSHTIKMGCMADFLRPIYKVVLDPFFESLGKLFGSVSIKKRVERVGNELKLHEV